MAKKRGQLPVGAVTCPNCEQPNTRDELELWNGEWVCGICGYPDPYWNQ